MAKNLSKKPPNLNLSKAKGNEEVVSKEVASPKDKLAPLKAPDSPGPLSKRWFRKQFGISRKKSRDDSMVQLTFNNNSARGHRRTSSLPDLASMLEAATSKTRHHTMPVERVSGHGIAAK